MRQEGYAGGYDAVRRHARQWRAAHLPASGGQAFVPLVFPPGEACQFDWSHEHVVLGGVTALVKVAHVRLCHSRAFYLRAYPRETHAQRIRCGCLTRTRGHSASLAGPAGGASTTT